MLPGESGRTPATVRRERPRRPLSLFAWILISVPVTAVALLLVMIEGGAGHGTFYLAVLLYAIPLLVSGAFHGLGGAAAVLFVALAFAELPLVVLALRAAGPGRRRWQAAGGLFAAHVLAIILVAAEGTGS